MSDSQKPVIRQKFLNGVYLNLNIASYVTALLGNVVKIHTVGGYTYEGIFRVFSPSFDVVLELAHDVTTSTVIAPDSIVEKIIFALEDIVIIEIINMKVGSISKNTFLKDCGILKLSCNDESFNNGEKVLEPWEPCGEGSDFSDLELTEGTGWNPQEMFAKNEELYGVTSDFNAGLPWYTYQLQPEQEQVDKLSQIMSTVELTDTPSSCKQLANTVGGPNGGNKKSKVRKSQSLGNGAVLKGSSFTKTQKKMRPRNGVVQNKSFDVHNSDSSHTGANNLTKNSLSAFELNIAPEKACKFPLQDMTCPKPRLLNPLSKEFIPSCLRPSPAVLHPTVNPNSIIATPHHYLTTIFFPPPFHTIPLYPWRPTLLYPQYTQLPNNNFCNRLRDPPVSN